MDRMTTYFSGYVQGVGFRFTAVAVARRYPGVTGRVRNLADGRVQLIAEGSRTDLEALVAKIREDMGAYIRSVDTNFTPGTGEFDGFQIAF